MAKKIKSFNVDEGVYNSLASMLKKYDSELSISYFVDKCLKELQSYFRTMENELKGSDEYEEIMAFVVKETARRTLIHTPDREAPGQSEGLTHYNLMEIEAGILPGIMLIDQEGGGEKPEISISELDEEIQYWRDEYEGQKRNLSRAFVRHLRSGKFTLSADRKYLIDKKTKKKYVNFIPNYIVEVASPEGRAKGGKVGS